MAIFRKNGKPVTWTSEAAAKKRAKQLGGTAVRSGGKWVVRTSGSGGGGAGSRPSSSGSGGKLARRQDGGAVLFGNRAAAEKAAQLARFGVDAKVVKTGGGKYGIKTGREVSAQQRADDFVDRDEMVGFYAGGEKMRERLQGRFGAQDYVITPGRYGQGFIVERRTELSGLDPESRMAIKGLDEATKLTEDEFRKGTGAGQQTFDQQVAASQATTGSIRDILNQQIASETARYDADIARLEDNAALGTRVDEAGRLEAYDQRTQANLQSLRDQLDAVNNPAGDIQAGAAQMAVQAEAAAGLTSPNLGGLAAGADPNDPTGQAIQQAQANQLAAEQAAQYDQAGVIQQTGQQQANLATMAAQQERAAIEAQIAQQEQLATMGRADYQGALQQRGQAYDAALASRQQDLEAARSQKAQGLQSLQVGLAGVETTRGQTTDTLLTNKRNWAQARSEKLSQFLTGRKDARTEAIQGLRTLIYEREKNYAEAQRDAEQWMAEMNLKLRGQELDMLGQVMGNQGQLDRALISAATQRQGQQTQFDVASLAQEGQDRRQQREQDFEREQNRLDRANSRRGGGGRGGGSGKNKRASMDRARQMTIKMLKDGVPIRAPNPDYKPNEGNTPSNRPFAEDPRERKIPRDSEILNRLREHDDLKWMTEKQLRGVLRWAKARRRRNRRTARRIGVPGA